LNAGGAEARRLALDALVAVDDGGRANAVVPALLAASQLPARDRALVTELVYGTCRRRRSCDWLVDRYTRGRTDRVIRAALRLGAYQLGWTRIPPHAAVSTAVAAVGGPGRSLVNAVLRRVAAELVAGPVAWPDAATEWSYPDWIVDLFLSELGPTAGRDALLTMNEPAATTARSDGYAQDRASQLVAAHVGAEAGDRILDVCAAPGGKATALAGAGPALVVAADISEVRSAVTAAAAARLGATPVATVVADGTRPPWRAGTFDRVLVDAPCSGLGVLRRRPDARWRVQPRRGPPGPIAASPAERGRPAAPARRSPGLQRLHPDPRRNSRH
jgi:16S rRNA (cytosine967-C5)-methyltransferase